MNVKGCCAADPGLDGTGGGVRVFVELTALAPRIAAPATPDPLRVVDTESFKLSVKVRDPDATVESTGLYAMLTVQLVPAAKVKDVPEQVPPLAMLNGGVIAASVTVS